LFSLTLTNINAKDTIKISNGEWPPFFSKDLKYDGVTSHVVKKAFSLENLTIEYEWYPWKRAFHLAKVGDIDATIGWEKRKDRESDFLFSDVILNGNVVFFYLKHNKFDWNTFNDLKELKIGTVSGYKYGNKIQKLEKIAGVSLHTVINEQKLFKMLIKERFDVVIINLDVGYGILNKYFLPSNVQKIAYHKKPLHTEYLRLLFSKKNARNKSIVKKFNRGLKQLKDNGTFKQYYENSRRGKYEKKQ